MIVEKENKFRFEKVMLIDDDAADNYISKKIIRSSSFAKEIIEFKTVEDALKHLRENSGKPEQLPQCIFLDLNLPGMNGIEFLSEFDKFGDDFKKSCKVVILTNAVRPEDMKKITRNPFVIMTLEKPLRDKDLEAM